VRRDVIVWGDCVKLRYGSGPEDNPWLWDHMTEYTRQMAKLFQALRIDNCHSTPIHVASHLLREARAIRSDLFVCAELFTGSEEKDMCFVTSLGINSLIREAMVSWDHQEISRLTLNYGGQPIGSLQQLPEFIRFDSAFENQNYNVSHMKSRPHNIFFDCTHDNEPPSQKRTPQDTLSNSAIVAFSCCATGSTFGYDQLVPHHVNIVEERRKYERCTSKSPLSSVKKYLNSFHSRMIEENCTEIFVKDYEDEIVLISRDDPLSHCGYTLIARTAYATGPNDSVSEVIDFPGCDVKVVCSAYFTKIEATEFQKDPKVINGLNSEISFIDGGVPDGWFSSNHNSKSSFIELKVLPPGAFIILQRMPLEPIRLISLPFLKGDLNVFELKKACANFDLNDFNYIMYRCEEEEKDHFPEIGGVYNIPNYGDLSYCGFEGFNLVLKSIERYNDLDHALCSNLREGTWILDYTVARLERLKDDRFDPLIHWTKLVFEHLKALSGYLRPKYAAKVFRVMDEAFKDRIFEQMSPRLQDCGEFGKTLALGSIQMVGRVPSTGLTVKAYNDSESDPILRILTYSSSMSAGLPHFSTHHMRCWGRDIFISFRGLLLIPGRFEVARAHLLAFSSCVYKGLIPNLLDSCRRPRYNARDATWWYLQALQDYCKYSPEGYAILGISVPLRFPGGEYVDFDDPSIFSRKKTIKEIVQQILQSHAEGIHFREWNAGPQLDSVMRWEGFQVDIFTDWRTGLIHGGNRWNCGTWMDKMGESELAGNRGIPTTPRDGAAIEITALHKSTLEWLASLHSFGFSGVKTFVGDQGKERFITYTEWSQLLSESFEGEYFMPDVGYYRDTVRLLKDCDENDTMITTNVATTYTPEQMRPNYFVAMAIAPELFNPCHGRCALALAERHLSGPLGMRTLAPFEAAYRPNYDNSLDCPDSSLAKGANYHQGPEWLWCMGFYLRAWLTFNISTADAASARKLVLTRLQPHRHFLLHSQSGSLPELTNENGSPCSDSCWNQAWSMACLLEVVLQVAATTKEQEQD
jgi:glycogen debranching enzyme